MIRGKVWNGLSPWGGVGPFIVLLVGIYRTDTSLLVLKIMCSAFLSLNGCLHGHGHAIYTSALLPVPVALPWTGHCWGPYKSLTGPL